MATFYGTEIKTYYVTKNGHVYLIQSVDWYDDREPELVRSLPRDATPLDPMCVDFDLREQAEELETY